MISRILSSDFPRSRVLSGLLILILLGLAFAPFLFPGAKALNVAAKILIFIVLIASFDLLLGYTGIFSFAHTMFFGIGAYGVAIASSRMGAGWDSLFIGMGGALALSLILSLVIGLMSLRVRALFYAMITLAVATAFLTLASQMSELTGGDDGLNFKLPDVFSPGTSFLENPVLGVAINGRLLTYYVLFVMAVVLFLAMLRIVNSPFGRVLQAIRENDFRAEAIGYRIVIFRIWSNILGALFATMAGCMLAMWLRYNGPDTSLSFNIMVNILLIIVIGGMGSMYGALAGTTIFLLAENYLQDLMKVVHTATAEIPFVSHLFDPDRWILWLGVMFILSVYFLPMGIVGKLRLRALRKK
ncbi:branched-chain amino acid ABC transporter permease [Noviherbaspirillum sedimenti]|uniref:Branched-chain amino acid ABC transporter permease n=1 Tax=Noviherbaspirillum sedimenti TaxID=2320865 RepID=A0A3A3G2R9_9BURK|nr:branched-chain amino acid ABC transporter permease [Noviherbaspirillum sedimenti]RJG02788.1 branched-chain amino acid ABC transporter permease [Noviherbaspirillum sedimenti]